MSKLRTSQGDDHPDAALKHLLDAQVLLGKKRADGAECLRRTFQTVGITKVDVSPLEYRRSRCVCD